MFYPEEKDLKVDDLKSIVGKNIQEIRKSRNMTQAKLAECINVETVSITRIERGINFPKDENLALIAKALDVEVYELFKKPKKPTSEEICEYIKKHVDKLQYKKLMVIKKVIEALMKY